MADRLCPVCKDKVVAGKCSFCGYVLTKEELDNPNYISYGGSENKLNTNWNGSSTTINECHSHEEKDHEINIDRGHDVHKLNQNNTVNGEEIIKQVTTAFHNTVNGGVEAEFSGEEPNKKTLDIMFTLSIILLFFSGFFSVAIAIAGMTAAKTQEYKKKFKTLLIVYASLLAVVILLVILVYIISLFGSF